jgi:hypothetical protein
MIKKILLLLLVLSMLTFAVSAEVDTDVPEEEFPELSEDIYKDIGDVEIEGTAGLTPDSSFYFLETLVENVLVGDDPETALEYKEEKILELKAMVDSGNQDGAEKALERVEKYNDILQKEVSPELDERVRASSKAVKVILGNIESELEGNEWDDVREAIDQNMKEEDKIALAAKISNKIAGLCKALSALDPLEYSNICKTGDDAPKWKRDLDQELTQEQEKEAKEFFEIMSECFDDPNECRCDDISVKPFADQCNVIAPLAAKCDSGDKEACEEMEKAGDPIDLLPDYLQNVMEDLEDRYGDSKHDMHVPIECVEAGATGKDECMKVMFKVHAPSECLEALESGKIDPQNEREAREQCDAIMFSAEAPQECIEAGLKDFRECDKYMFQLDAPQECLDVGLTGDGRDDWKKCDVIRFKLDAPQECLDAGIDGSKKDDWKKCESIRFKLDSPQECIDAGLTGEGRDDWKKCNKITFLLDAPEECRQFADDRDPWKKCQPVQFKLDAHPACLEAGLDGTGRRDWDECKIIQFKAESPQECLDAGLTGKGRNDWDECHKLQEKTETQGKSKSDCAPDELHICDESGCYCTSDSNEGCGAVDCQQGYHCEYGKCFPDGGSCGDCASKCPGASSTSCDDGECKCYYDDKEPQKGDDSEGSECNDGCEQECGEENTDCVDGKCVCLGYGPNGPPGFDDGPGGDIPIPDLPPSEQQPIPEPVPFEPEPEAEPAPEPEEPKEESSPEPEAESNSGGDAITGGAVSGFFKKLFN